MSKPGSKRSPSVVPTMVAAVVAGAGLLLGGCDGGDTSPEDGATAAVDDAAAGELTVTWLDDDTLAQSVAFHHLGARLSGPASIEARLPVLARAALTERATSLGFTRLDDLQFAMRCDEAAPAETACTGEIAAVASR